MQTYAKALGYIHKPVELTPHHTLNIRFADTAKRIIINGHQNDLLDVIADFNFSGIQEMLNNSKRIKHLATFPVPDVAKIVEHHITAAMPEYDTIPYEHYRRIPDERPNKYDAVVKHDSFKLKRNILHLATHTRCVCEETGISFAVALPSPIAVNMIMLHPFAFHNNVVAFIKGYQKTGVPIASLEASVIAGMLITILKHKQFTQCRDYVKANQRLRTVNKKTLCYVLTYFYRANIRYNQPQINLLEDCEPTAQLIAFLKICRGEDATLQAHHMQVSKEKTVKAKVYQTTEDKQGALLKQDIKSCKVLLDRIRKDRPDVSFSLYESFYNRISKLGFLTDYNKQQLIDDLYGTFNENETTKALHLVILSNDTTEIQKDLLSVTQDAQEFKGKKLDLAVLLGRKPKE